MTIKKITPCLDIRDGRVVKGKKFAGIRDVADPVELAAFYSKEGADELVFYDITASIEGRTLFTDLLKQVAGVVAVPLMAGGGISRLEDIDRMLDCGADKVSINSGAIRNPGFIYEAARKYGSCRIALSMDVKKVGNKYFVCAQGGQKNTGIDALEWARQARQDGAGELVVNSIDADGVRQGFDLLLLEAVAEASSLPLVASGGAGSIDHFVELFRSVPSVSTGLAASVFHHREVSIGDLKQALRRAGVPVRLPGEGESR